MHLRPGTRQLAMAGLLLVAAAMAWPHLPGYSSFISAAQVARYAARFGQGTEERLLAWQGFIQARRDGVAPRADGTILAAVNRHFNRVRFLADSAHWSREDYWATPAEFVGSDGGDCEDYSIAKYFALKELGVPIARLRITYVRSARLRQAHMVLAYYPAPNAEPLILDNLEDEVRPASQRPDLVPVYSFNDEDVQITGREGSGAPGRIRQWRDLKLRLEQESRG